MVGTSLSLLYIAGSMQTAQTVEQRLSEYGIDYTLSLEPFRTTSVLSGEYVGLFVYVPTVEHARGRALLEAAGLWDTMPLDVTAHETTG